MKVHVLLAAAVLLFAAPVFGSTFVGNGGNVGDVELLAAVGQVRDTFRRIEIKQPEENLCQCRRSFTGRKICKPLDNLTEKQQLFCSKVMLKTAKELSDLLRRQGQVNFNWTHEAIYVKDGTRLRGADAVTDRKTNQVTLNQGRFLDLNGVDRFFLMAHELLHLVQFDGKPLVDDGSIGPFDGEDGGRRLLNAVASAALMQSDRWGILQSYRRQLRRPRGWKKNWIDISVGSSNDSGNTDDNAYYMKQHDDFQLAYRRYFGSFGLVASYRASKAEEGLLSTIEVKEDVNAFGLGVTYRQFLFSNPLSYWGQSHLVVSLLAEYMHSEMSVSDPYVSEEAEASSVGAILECKYYMPFLKGFWYWGGFNVQAHSYEYSFADLKYDTLRYAGMIGVSYGF